MSDTPSDPAGPARDQAPPAPKQPPARKGQPSAPRIPPGGVKYEPPVRVETSTPLAKAIGIILLIATLAGAVYAFFFFEHPLAPMHGVVVLVGGLYLSVRLAGFTKGKGDS